MKFESGAAAYDRNYNLIFMIAGLAMAGWFYYDHTTGYYQKNAERARERITELFSAEHADLPLPDAPTKDDFNQVHNTKPTEPSKYQEALGEPFMIKIAPNRDGVMYFASKWGIATVVVKDQRVANDLSGWESWGKTKDDIESQLYWSFVALAFALVFLYRVYRAASLKIVVDDDGIVYAGRRIPAQALSRITDYQEKGLCDVYYNLGGGERRLRLDNQKIRKFEEAIDAICELKGFPDPRGEGDEHAAPAEPESPVDADEADSSDDD